MIRAPSGIVSPLDAVGIARVVAVAPAVPALLVVEHQRRRRAQAVDGVEDARADLRVALDDRALGLVQRAGLVEDVLGHADLADVVERAGDPQMAELGRGQPQAAAHLQGVAAHPLEMPLGVDVLGLDGAGQGAHHPVEVAAQAPVARPERLEQDDLPVPGMAQQRPHGEEDQQVDVDVELAVDRRQAGRAGVLDRLRDDQGQPGAGGGDQPADQAVAAGGPVDGHQVEQRGPVPRPLGVVAEAAARRPATNARPIVPTSRSSPATGSGSRTTSISSVQRGDAESEAPRARIFLLTRDRHRPAGR